MHRVAVVALEGVVAFDLAVACESFERTVLGDGRRAYGVVVCGVERTVRSAAFEIRVRAGLEALRGADTIMLPGSDALGGEVPPALIAALRRAARRGARIASICSGAFILAATGLLDGLRATTHWLAADELARRHPSIEVDPDVLYVDNGQLLTSAGAAAGMDLCLHMIRSDHGAAVAADIARLAVMPLERAGGQSQFIAHPPPLPDTSSLQPLLQWLEENLHRSLTLTAIAERAAMSVRTLNRRFREQTGTTPLQWVLRARVRRAQQLLETTAHPIDTVAARAGFGSPTALREHFQRLVSTSPQAYRRAFRAPC